MKKKPSRPKTSSQPRAIDRARDKSTDVRVGGLLHKLQVHGEKITTQNEQLLKAQGELDQARDRYADLYDFAPIGFVALDLDATILEINRAAASLLGRPRRSLIDLPLLPVIVDDQREMIRDLLTRCRHADLGQPPQVEVRLKTDPPRVVRVMARPVKISGVGQILVALLDVTAERHLSAERQSLYERAQERSGELAAEVLIRVNAEERVKALLSRVVEVQEQERRRLALNLHDHLGQQLTALRLTLTTLKDGGLSGPDAQQRFDRLEHIISQLDRDVDFLAWELRPPALDDMGLDAALRDFIHHWSDLHCIAADFHAARADEPRLSHDIESHLYRIVQEALNNISKHAEAQHVSVLIERRHDQVTLIVEDDGRGFDLDEVRSRSRSTAMGMAGIQERAATMGGVVQYESAPGKGTTLFVRIPLRIEDSQSGAKSLHSHQK